MENAADALKMVAAILIFIIAIASSFSLFGTAKQTADSIIGMRDKQAYLGAAELDTVLYTSSETISKGDVDGFTTNGDRIVGVSDVISTIYRYSKEKYGVTIVESNGEVIARYDSNTEVYVQNYDRYGSDFFEEYKNIVKKYIQTDYCKNINFPDNDKIEALYQITVERNSNIKYGAPWSGNDEEIQKRINADILGSLYEYNGQKYQGKDLKKTLTGKKIIEVTNEIDQSKYLKDNEEETSLLQQYQMPTVEVIYIVYDK